MNRTKLIDNTLISSDGVELRVEDISFFYEMERWEMSKRAMTKGLKICDYCDSVSDDCIHAVVSKRLLKGMV